MSPPFSLVPGRRETVFVDDLPSASPEAIDAIDAARMLVLEIDRMIFAIDGFLKDEEFAGLHSTLQDYQSALVQAGRQLRSTIGPFG